MQENALVCVGRRVINLDAIAGCHWEGQKLVVHFIGGRFELLTGEAADRFFGAIVSRARDLSEAVEKE